jgi:hypothetical protein
MRAALDIQTPAEQAASRVYEISDSILAGRDGLIVVIEVYVDESGTHDDSKNVAVSAVWADKTEWFRWTLDWVAAKAPIKVYHSVDCHNRDGEYAGWTKEQRDEHVLRVLPVIRDHAIFGHFAAVSKSAIVSSIQAKTAPNIGPLVRRFIGDGIYLVCLYWAIRSAWEHLYSQGHREVAFFCENNQYAHDMLDVFTSLRELHPDWKATFTVGSKGDYVPLQCADIVAFEGNRQMQIQPNFHAKRRKPLEAIDPIGNRFGFLKYTAEEVGPMANFIIERLKRLAEEEGATFTH